MNIQTADMKKSDQSDRDAPTSLPSWCSFKGAIHCPAEQWHYDEKHCAFL